jgi:hypothetical protein
LGRFPYQKVGPFSVPVRFKSIKILLVFCTILKRDFGITFAHAPQTWDWEQRRSDTLTHQHPETLTH